MSLQAYQTAMTRNEDPRQTEYRLLAQVTRALMAAESAGKSDLQTRIAALDHNRQVWTVFANDCAGEGNSLTPALRAQIISLSLWVSRHTSLVIRNKEDIGPLIEINRIIMQGLMPAAGTEQAG
ncbi:MAG: flagellar biosynthesis regulator FlaF [Asticcacaulis sp.]